MLKEGNRLGKLVVGLESGRVVRVRAAVYLERSLKLAGPPVKFSDNNSNFSEANSDPAANWYAKLGSRLTNQIRTSFIQFPRMADHNVARHCPIPLIARTLSRLGESRLELQILDNLI
jgi:hypothetical protein